MDSIGKYKIVCKLGEGATSAVYLAHDPFAARDVAIKVVEDHPGKESAARFQRKFFITEASLAGKLDHPHIVQIYDAVLDHAPPYIVMEYVPGGTLEPYTYPERLLPVSDVLEIIFKCTRALDFAWRMGVIHRDLKPANLLRVDGTNVKVSDFGAAMSVSAESTQVSGVGSPAYMSPQQVKDHPLNHQTDIFSLGVVMYQLLTGLTPFTGTTNYSIMYQITHVDPPPPSLMRTDLSPALDAIVMRALAKDLEQRYPSWDQFSYDLAEVFRAEVASLDQETLADTEKFNLLRGMPFFDTFSDAALWEVMRLADWQKLEGGTRFINEGDLGDGFFVIAQGNVKVTRGGKLLNVLAAGDCVGEMAYLKRNTGFRVADVTTTCASTVMHVPNAALEHASDACRHSFDRAFLGILVERLDLANRRLSNA